MNHEKGFPENAGKRPLRVLIIPNVAKQGFKMPPEAL
jgi:hypothetical protein